MAILSYNDVVDHDAVDAIVPVAAIVGCIQYMAYMRLIHSSFVYFIDRSTYR